MVTREQIIDCVFNSVKDVLLDGINDPNDIKTVEDGYRQRIDNFIDEKLLTAPNLEDGKIKWFLLNIKKYDLNIFSLPPQHRIDMFKIRPLIDALNVYRDLAYKFALHYLNNQSVPENYIKHKNDILKYMNEIKEKLVNREDLILSFNEIYNQTLLDLEFASGNTDSISERINEIYTHQKLLKEKFNLK